MSNLLPYKNYNGTVEYAEKDKCFYGKVVGIKSLLSYEASSVQELEKNFHSAIDEYLEDCKLLLFTLSAIIRKLRSPR